MQLCELRFEVEVLVLWREGGREEEEEEEEVREEREEREEKEECGVGEECGRSGVSVEEYSTPYITVCGWVKSVVGVAYQLKNVVGV